MLTVHHLGVSQSDRIVWLCEELELPYTLIRYQRDPVSMLAPAEYKALHPAGTAPVITDGPVVLAETAAIMDYILARYGNGRLVLGPDHPDFADFLFWYHFPNGSLMPAMMTLSGAFGAFMRERVDRALAMADARLANGPWLLGETFTVADIMLVFPLATMPRFVDYDLSPFSNLARFLEQVGERPAYQRAMAKAEPAA